MAAAEAAGLAAQPPEPSRFWIRYAPQRWPAPEHPWVDLARGALGDEPGRIGGGLLGDEHRDSGGPPDRDGGRLPGGDAAASGGSAERPLDDLLYLPPVAPERRPERDALAAMHLERGTPVLVQVLPGEEPGPAEATAVYDLLPALLAPDLAPLDRLPRGAAAVWPLLAGLTDEPALWDPACARLAAAGAATVQPLEVSLSAAGKRRLAEGRGDEVFHALFHRGPRSEREFAAAAHRHGLAVFLPRPLPRPPFTGGGNRRLAADLLLMAELWLALGHPLGRGLALLRTARWIDASAYDVAALAREGNLAVVPEVDAESRQLIEEWAASGRLAPLATLHAEYLAGPR